MPWSAHPYGDEHNHGNYREDRRDLWENNTDLILSYNKENLGNSGFSISANAGGTVRNMKYTSSYTSTNQLIIPEVYSFANSYLPVRAYSYGSNLLMLSAYYSADITFRNYFTLSTTGRVDKTSALPSGHNAYFYPSVSLSSVISDYIDMPEAISFLKVRGSFANVKDGGTSPFIGASFQALGASSPVGYGNSYYTPYDGPSYNLGHSILFNTLLLIIIKQQQLLNYLCGGSRVSSQPHAVISEVGLDFRTLKRNRCRLERHLFSIQGWSNHFKSIHIGNEWLNLLYHQWGDDQKNRC